MDQSRYWMIQKERTCLNSHAFGDSWEEQAFAEDAAGPLGGCVWPPRSYTCSFCRREFRSAQALGGHMNVHRRDRAKLKLHNINSGGSSNNQILESANTSFDRRVLQNPIEICNPNFDLDHALFSSSSSPKPSTASILRPFTCSFSQAEQQPILSCSKFEPRKRFHILQDLAGNQDTGCITKVVELNSTDSKKNNHEVDEVHLTGKLNSLVRKRCETPSFHDEEDGLIFKKRQIDDGADHYFFPKNSKLQVINGDELVEPRAVVQLHERSPNSTLESLDLELRLGT